MGRKTAMLRAELELAELEEAFVEAKQSGEVTHQQKLELREARRRFRTLRNAEPPAAGEVRPDAVSASVEVQANG